MPNITSSTPEAGRPIATLNDLINAMEEWLGDVNGRIQAERNRVEGLRATTAGEVRRLEGVITESNAAKQRVREGLTDAQVDAFLDLQDGSLRPLPNPNATGAQAQAQTEAKKYYEKLRASLMTELVDDGLDQKVIPFIDRALDTVATASVRAGVLESSLADYDAAVADPGTKLDIAIDNIPFAQAIKTAVTAEVDAYLAQTRASVEARKAELAQSVEGELASVAPPAAGEFETMAAFRRRRELLSVNVEEEAVAEAEEQRDTTIEKIYTTMVGVLVARTPYHRDALADVVNLRALAFEGVYVRETAPMDAAIDQANGLMGAAVAAAAAAAGLPMPALLTDEELEAKRFEHTLPVMTALVEERSAFVAARADEANRVAEAVFAAAADANAKKQPELARFAQVVKLDGPAPEGVTNFRSFTVNYFTAIAESEALTHYGEAVDADTLARHIARSGIGAIPQRGAAWINAKRGVVAQPGSVN